MKRLFFLFAVIFMTANIAIGQTYIPELELVNDDEVSYYLGNFTGDINYYRKAAENGHAKAQNALGLCYIMAKVWKKITQRLYIGISKLRNKVTLKHNSIWDYVIIMARE